MRADALGLFWEDKPPPPRVKAEKAKCSPPEPTWLRPDYLPKLEEALRFRELVHVMSYDEMVEAAIRRERLLFDIECYSNYFLISFRSFSTGHLIYFEMTPSLPLDIAGLKWVLHNFTIVGFNSISYDMVITQLAVAGKSNAALKAATNKIIVEGWHAKEIYKQFKVVPIKGFDHIDLIEVAPLRASLKIYGGRLHVPRMQDLPFHPETELSPEQMAIVRWYNINADLTNTGYLFQCLQEHIDLRYTLSNESKVDVRSKSDAQIAESVIAAELKKLTGQYPGKPIIPAGTGYQYQVPHFIRYETDLMNWALDIVRKSWFVVEETGSVAMPEAIRTLKLRLNNTVYQMGVGGLHSTESSVSHYTDEDHILIDKDVTSYYPFIILNLGLYPKHLGPAFLQVYKTIVDRRIAAKARGDKVVADSLKITINGSFGKLGSKYSILYAPDLLFQVTITGQLSLLMLIERLERRGIPVVSANTDGIVIKCPRAKKDIMDTIVAQWERDTGFNTEEARYMSLHSRDVNNYIAVKQKFDKATKQWVETHDGVKCKGAYANPWADKKNPAERLHKNPVNTICIEAVQEYLVKRTPIAKTIRQCTDIRKFVSVRKVKGGAVKIWDRVVPAHKDKKELILLTGFQSEMGGWWHPSMDQYHITTLDAAYNRAISMWPVAKQEYLGESIRWYYSSKVQGDLLYAASGKRVPRSEGAQPLLDIPDAFPSDVDYEWYEKEAERILSDVGYGLQPA